MSWGHRIIVIFVAFVLFLGVLVYRSFQSNVSLVSPDYYRQELAFQEQIDKIRNEKTLKNSVEVMIDADLEELYIRFPRKLQVIAAEIMLYRPSDASQDRRWRLELDHDNSQRFSTRTLARGLWKVTVEWQDPSRSYIKEQNMFFP